MICPNCGYPFLDSCEKRYDRNKGCIGLLLFGWIGLLLGYYRGRHTIYYCDRCGYEFVSRD